MSSTVRAQFDELIALSPEQWLLLLVEAGVRNLTFSLDALSDARLRRAISKKRLDSAVVSAAGNGDMRDVGDALADICTVHLKLQGFAKWSVQISDAFVRLVEKGVLMSIVFENCGRITEPMQRAISNHPGWKRLAFNNTEGLPPSWTIKCELLCTNVAYYGRQDVSEAALQNATEFIQHLDPEKCRLRSLAAQEVDSNVFAEFLKSCRSLVTIQLWPLRYLNQNLLSALSKCRDLRSLALHRVSNEDIPSLAAALQVLDLTSLQLGFFTKRIANAVIFKGSLQQLKLAEADFVAADVLLLFQSDVPLLEVVFDKCQMSSTSSQWPLVIDFVPSSVTKLVVSEIDGTFQDTSCLMNVLQRRKLETLVWAHQVLSGGQVSEVITILARNASLRQISLKGKLQFQHIAQVHEAILGFPPFLRCNLTNTEVRVVFTSVNDRNACVVARASRAVLAILVLRKRGHQILSRVPRDVLLIVLKQVWAKADPAVWWDGWQEKDNILLANKKRKY